MVKPLGAENGKIPKQTGPEIDASSKMVKPTRALKWPKIGKMGNGETGRVA